MKMQQMSGCGIKDCFTEASLGWISFRKYNQKREFHMFNEKYDGDFIRKSIKGGRIDALNSYFESKHLEKYLTPEKNI